MDRVKTWCKYTWDNQKTFDERTILQHLPEKLMTGNKAKGEREREREREREKERGWGAIGYLLD